MGAGSRQSTPKNIRNPFAIKWPKQGGKKLIGGYVSIKDSDHLALLAVSKGTTISNIFRGLIKKCLEEAEGVDDIVTTLASTANKEWFLRIRENKDTPKWKTPMNLLSRYREYQHAVRLQLLKRSVSEPKIIQIIQKMEELCPMGVPNETNL